MYTTHVNEVNIVMPRTASWICPLFWERSCWIWVMYWDDILSLSVAINSYTSVCRRQVIETLFVQPDSFNY